MTAYWGGQVFRLDKPHQRPYVTLGTENSVKPNEIAMSTSTNEIFKVLVRFDAGN